MIYRGVLMNGVPLEAGAYRVELAPSLDSVTFLKGRKAIVTAPCKVGVVPTPVTGDTVHYRPREDGREEIARIVFAGSSLSIELGPQVKGPPIAEAGPER